MKSKKILLGSLSTMALVATPIAAVVSCNDNKAAEAAGDKKAAFNAADLIKKIGKDDKGLVASFQMGPAGMQKFYVSEADAKKASTMKFMGQTLSFPALTVGTSNLKVTVGTDAEVATAKKIAREVAEKAAKANKANDAAAIKAAGDAAANSVPGKLEVPITVAKAVEGQFIVNKHMVKANAADVATFLKDELTVTEGKEGLYPFAFKKDPADALKPELTVESKTAFDKIFTDLGLQVTALEFTKTKADSKDITVKTLTIVKTTPVAAKGSVQGDLTALKNAIPATTATTSVGAVIAVKAKAAIKNAGTAMTADKLVEAINTFIKASSTFLAKPTGLNDALIKDDMVISAQITTPTAASTNGVLTLTFSKTGLTDETTTIVITNS